MNISNFIQELKRRNVIKVATAYAIAGWLVIQIFATVAPQLGFPEWIAPLVTILVIIGFPMALVFAWAFELTPDGIQKSKDVDITESVTSRTGKKLNGLIISVLSVALFFVVIERVFFAKASFLEDSGISLNIENASIAVLPFVNMSSDAENEFFSDGLSEELLNALAKVEDIQVAGRTSSFKFKGQNENLTEIGAELGVANILEGSVRKSGDRLRITAQLIRVSDGFHMWSETYDRELTATDIFDIQEEISRKVLSELKIRLLPEEDIQLAERPTKDIEAYNAFLEATQLEADRKADEIELAIEKYNQAIRIDPTFALAYSRLAYAYGLLYSYGDLSLEDAKFLVRKNVDQALLLDENQGKAYQALALYYLDYESDYEKAEEAAKKAIELSPNDPFSYNVLSNIYNTQRLGEESREFGKKAYDLDPLNPIIASNHVNDLEVLERYDEALELVNKIIERNPDYSPAIIDKVGFLKNSPNGEVDEAFKYLFSYYKSNRTDINSIYELYQLSRTLGMMPLMEFYQSEMEKYYPNNTSLLNMRGWTLVDKGEYAKAEETFDEYIDEYGESFKEYAIPFLNGIYYNQGKYQEWVDLVEEFNPEFTVEDPKIDINKRVMLLNYSSYLKLLGETERADKLQAIAIDAIQENIKRFKEEGRERPAMFQQGQIDVHTGNIEGVRDLAETMYFEKNEKNVIGFIYNYHFARDLLAGDLESEELKERIYDDLGIMRVNVVEYLKAEGEWKEEWDISIKN